MADLMRISGVGEEYSELLEAAGVDTVKELKHRNAENLAETLREVNEVKKLTRQVPAANQVARWIAQWIVQWIAQWIAQAGALDPKISH
jgi:hypothetical protein